MSVSERSTARRSNGDGSGGALSPGLNHRVDAGVKHRFDVGSEAMVSFSYLFE